MSEHDQSGKFADRSVAIIGEINSAFAKRMQSGDQVSWRGAFPWSFADTRHHGSLGVPLYEPASMDLPGCRSGIGCRRPMRHTQPRARMRCINSRPRPSAWQLLPRRSGVVSQINLDSPVVTMIVATVVIMMVVATYHY
jgi:hypothetical protein